MATDTADPGHLEAAPVRRARLAAALLGLIGVLAITCMASLALGARDVPIGQVLDAIFWPDLSDNDHRAVVNERLPRTVLGLIGGAALGLAGVLLQGLTRNPIADPGLLGINAGASLAVVAGITYLDVSGPDQYVWFAFVGAAVAALLVYGVSSVGRDGATPVRLALVGAALTATATSLITMVLLTDRTALGLYRFWAWGPWSTATSSWWPRSARSWRSGRAGPRQCAVPRRDDPGGGPRPRARGQRDARPAGRCSPPWCCCAGARPRWSGRSRSSA